MKLKFIYSEKATKFCEIFSLLLSYVVPVESKVKISQNFVAFSEYMNFTWQIVWKKIVIRTFSLRVHYFFPSFSLDISIHFWCCNLFFNTFFIPLSLEFKYLTLEKCFFTAHTENYSNRILFSVYPCCFYSWW